MKRIKKFLAKLNLLRRAWEDGYKNGRETELQYMELAGIVWGEDRHGTKRGYVDKPATIRLWKQRHINRWNGYGELHGPIFLREVPYNKKEHEQYLELFPDLEKK